VEINMLFVPAADCRARWIAGRSFTISWAQSSASVCRHDQEPAGMNALITTIQDALA
jgi:hypothetical protein